MQKHLFRYSRIGANIKSINLAVKRKQKKKRKSIMFGTIQQYSNKSNKNETAI